MKIKKLADWICNNKRYQIVEKPHSIFQTEVIIREFNVPPQKRVEKEEEE